VARRKKLKKNGGGELEVDKQNVVNQIRELLNKMLLDQNRQLLSKMLLYQIKVFFSKMLLH
jgi:hypothetical protein